MSWTQREAGAPQPCAAPPQNFTNQQNVYSGYSEESSGQPPGQYWGYNQQYQYQEQSLPPTQYQHYNHNYPPPPQQQYQQNYYQPQQAPPDTWDDNWDWGWDEANKHAAAQQTAPAQVYDNANTIEESFAPSDAAWNWTADDKKNGSAAPPAPISNQAAPPAGLPANQAAPPAAPPSNQAAPPAAPPSNLAVPHHSTPPVQHAALQAHPTPAPALAAEPPARPALYSPAPPADVRRGEPVPETPNLQNVNDPNMPLTADVRPAGDRAPLPVPGRRFHPDNLTPQWSIESQMSQESSDGPPTRSESTYRSDDRSRNSDSPSAPADNYDYSRPSPDRSYAQDGDAPTRADDVTQNDVDSPPPRDDRRDLARTMRDLTLVNRENPPSEDYEMNFDTSRRNSQQSSSFALPPPPAGPRRGSSGVAPPPAAPSPARPPSASAAAASHPPAALPPPTGFPPALNSQNPFKHTGPFAHKPPATTGAGPGYAGKPAPVREPVGFEANLETTPDNSERPDRPPAGAARSPSPPAAPPAPVPDNLEVAPRTERNRYLQTAHLSGGDYGEPEDARFAGVRRGPVGRREGEPPPGLARLVPGRPTGGDGSCDRPADPYRDLSADPYRDRPDAYRRADGDYRAADAWEPRVVPGFEREFPPATAERAPPGDGSASPPAPERRDDAGERGAASSAEPPASPAPPEPVAERRDERDRHPRSDRHRERDERRLDRDDRRPERDERRPDRDERHSERDRRDRRDRERRSRDDSPESRRRRRGARSRRYDTEDTDYYSDKERERRRHREGSHAARPPRPEERGYRDIDPARHSVRRRDHRRRVTFSRRARALSALSGGEYSPVHTGTDEEGERRRERRPRHGARRTHDPYYDGYASGAYGGPYRAQYEYYERLRAADPAAYMQLYTRLMAARHHDAHDGYAGAAYGARDERASVHSGRSSAHGLKGHDTYYGRHESLRDAASLRADDASDRDLTTEVSLPTNLDGSTVRSERMTPPLYSTVHVKARVAARQLVVVRGAWPADGRPATVQLLSLRHAVQRAPLARDMQHPGPLLKGVTHKKSVIEYCGQRARAAAREAGADPLGYCLLWELLALMLRQNGVVVGSDIAELLMKNTREHEYISPAKPAHDGSSVSGSETRSSPEPADPAHEEASPAVDEREALHRLRELLLSGNRQEALEWAMSSRLWGHALQLAAHSDRRARAAVAARFLAALPPADPLHTLYAALQAQHPPSLEEAGDWRPHVAIILANGGARPDHDARALLAFGDRLAARGLPYCAQFCYVAGGERFAPHPQAPLASPEDAARAVPRLSLLLAGPGSLAATRAILATEVWEYARSLHGEGPEPALQPYKLVMACRLLDCGECERALGYVEQAARAVAAAPHDYSPRLVRALAELADRLRYHEPALAEAGAEEESPRHQQWLADVQAAARMLQAEASQNQPEPATFAPSFDSASTFAPVPTYDPVPAYDPAPAPPALADDTQYTSPHYSWEHVQQYQQQQQQQQTSGTAGEEGAHWPPPAPPADDWARTEEHHLQGYDSTYWQPDNSYAYGEASSAGAEGAESSPRPTITLPAAHAPPAHSYGDDEHHQDAQPDEQADTKQQSNSEARDTDTPKSSRGAKADGKGKEGGKSEGGKGWLGGILTKLSLRPPNQMILPDDSNPSIVWDAEQKRWRNLDGDEPSAAPPPPPPAATLAHLAQNSSTPNQSPASGPGAPPPAAGAPPVSNIFKMQKGRHIKKSYVDVFNPSGAATRPLPPAAAVLGPAPALSSNPSYFVPDAAQVGAYEQ